MKNGGEKRLGVTLVTAKNQKSCWKVRVRTRACGILRRCLTVGWSGDKEKVGRYGKRRIIGKREESLEEESLG